MATGLSRSLQPACIRLARPAYSITSQPTCRARRPPATRCHSHTTAAVAAAATASGALHLFAALPAAAAQPLFDLADIDARTASTIARFLGPALSLGTLMMIVRIVLSWYPQIDGKKLPWALAVKPTEPVLGPTRRVIPAVGGVDITPIVWVALLSFANEILLGPQGILNLLQRKADLP